MGTASLVLGIIALVLSLTIFFGIVCGVLAIVFGAIGRSRARRGEATNYGSATAGLITGTLGLAIAVFFIVLVIPTSNHYCFHFGTGTNPCG